MKQGTTNEENMIDHKSVCTSVYGFLLLLCLIPIENDANAQWKITVKGPKDSPTFTSSDISTTGSNTVPSGITTVVVTCANDVKCTDVGMHTTPQSTSADKLAVYNKPGTAPTDSKAEFSINSDRLKELTNPQLIVSLSGSDKQSYPLLVGAERAATSTESESIPLFQLVGSQACSGRQVTGSGNEFVVTPMGDVLATPKRHLNESNRVSVIVLSDSRLAPLIHVERKSAFRPVRVTNILGANTTLVNVESLNGRQSLGEEGECVERQFELNDFASGRGEVEISALGSTGKEITGSFDFRVNELYTGVFTLGAVRTTARDPSFGSLVQARDTVIDEVATRVADTLITETNNRGDRLLYVLMYTPFVWGARDVTVSPPHFWQRINPTLGVVLNDIANNGLLGLAVDIGNNLHMTGGVHVAKVTTLDPNSTLHVGDRIGSLTVPTTKKWQYRLYWGAGIDLRAALDFLKAAAAGTGSN